MYFFILLPITVFGWLVTIVTLKLYADDKPVIAFILHLFNPYHLCVAYTSFKLYENLIN